MAQPTAYNRQTSFTNFQAQSPTAPLPGNDLDAELNAIKTTLDGLRRNIALIQRDDGALQNESVGLDQLSEDIEVGWQAPEVWVTATAYVVGNTVFHGAGFYRCLVAHTAGTFSTDLAAEKWELIVDLSGIPLVDASQIANTPAGSIVATNVQAAIDELALEKAAASHTHLSSAITDSTAAGRNMLTAANLAAQKALLELGDLAFEDTVPITAVDAQFAFTGIIEPAALAIDTNDWAPTGVATASTIRMSASTSGIDITGLLASERDGEIKILENVGSTYPLTLLPQNAGSAAANRFALPHPVVVGPGESVVLKYDLDGTSPRWRLAQAVSAHPVAAGFKNLKIINGATADEQMVITADAITLENDAGQVYRAKNVSVTASNTASGANGLDSGSVANSTWYSIWVIYNPETNTLAALLSTSATAPTLPSGSTFKTRVGWNRTNGTADFHRIVQYGRRAQYRVLTGTATAAYPIVISGATGNISTPTYTSQAVSSVVPSTAAAIGLLLRVANGQSALAGTSPDLGSVSGSLSNPPPLMVSGSGVHSASGTLLLDGTNVYYAADHSSSGLFCTGWEDNL